MMRLFQRIVIVSALLVSPLAFMAKINNHCPAIQSIHYDVPLYRYESTTTDGILWQSETMAAISPTPKGEYTAIMGRGSMNNAEVQCFYRLGNNHFFLKSNRRFILEGSGWMQVTTAFGIQRICKKEACSFRLLKTVIKKGD